MRRLLLLAAAAALAGAGSVSAATAAHVTIRHQDAGCHAWSLDGGPFRASLTISIRAGEAVEFTNDDVMTHRLVQLAGRRLALPPTMTQSTFHHPGGGTVLVRFARPGTYRLRTVDGDEDAVATSGSENVLRLLVHVH